MRYMVKMAQLFQDYALNPAEQVKQDQLLEQGWLTNEQLGDEAGPARVEQDIAPAEHIQHKQYMQQYEQPPQVHWAMYETVLAYVESFVSVDRFMREYKRAYDELANSASHMQSVYLSGPISSKLLNDFGLTMYISQDDPSVVRFEHHLGVIPGEIVVDAKPDATLLLKIIAGIIFGYVDDAATPETQSDYLFNTLGPFMELDAKSRKNLTTPTSREEDWSDV